MCTTHRVKSLLSRIPMGMILQTPRRTKEPYRLRKPRRSSATAQPTQQQPKNEVSPAWHGSNLITSFIPVPCGRRHLRGKTRSTRLASTPRMSPKNEVYPEVLCFGSERVRSTKLKAAVGKYTARKTQRG